MAQAWQDEIRLALLHRDHREHALAPVIAHYSRLAQQTLALKERNNALVHAARTGGTGGGAAQGRDTEFVPLFPTVNEDPTYVEPSAALTAAQSTPP